MSTSGSSGRQSVTLRIELAECLRSDVDSAEQRLLAFVRALDLAYDGSGTDLDAELEGLLREILARAAIALAPLVRTEDGEPMPTVACTADAARAFVASPTAERWDVFEAASTASYPFGPGDGCLAVDELGGHGARGAGDHGPGFLWQVAVTAGAGRVCEAMRTELGAWLADGA